MDKPIFPLIDIYDSYFVDLVPAEASLTKAPATEILTEDNHSDLYDAEGNVWHYRLISKEVKDTFLSRLFAYFVDDSKHNAMPVWTRVREYHIEDLKDVLKDCVDKDEDLLTQHEEAEIIKQEISIAFSFNDLVDTLNKYVFSVNEEEILAQQKQREENNRH